MKRTTGLTIAALLTATPLVASAAEGYAVANVNMRAGPSTQYPVVTLIAAGTPVAIQGCTTGWSWCDVIAGPNRG